MIVLPCSMGTLGSIAHGLAGNLIERAADVCLKERRRLILCVRETPFHLIHLRNMTAVAEAGATVFPLIPTFYNHPETVADIARNYVHRVLQHIGLPQPGAYTWGADERLA
jgi:4-hydroxy-3-polyprenylbenzoate decarboxylase